MKCTPFRAALLVTGIFSLGFQICAIIVPAWYRFRLPVKFGYSTLDIDYDLGFWMAIVCFDDGVSRDDVCEFKNIQQMSNNITIGSQNMDIGGLNVMRILTIVGGVLSASAFCLMCIHFRQMDTDTRHQVYGIAGAIFWAIAATFVVAVVALHTSQYISTKEKLKEERAAYFKIFLPWAIVLSGLGVFLAVATGLALAISMCRHTQRVYSGYYPQFKA